MDHIPIWIEIPTRDAKKLSRFYAELFPHWSFEDSDKNAEMVFFHAARFDKLGTLGGGFVKMPDGCPVVEQTPMGSGMTVYFDVESVDNTEQLVHKLGGKTVLSKMAQADNGWFANFTDIEGNRFGVYESAKKCGAQAQA